MIKNEWKSLLHNKILIIVVLAIILIPAIYAGFFLKSMWDPYGSLSDLPVAVVNNDKAADYQGKTLTIGDDLANALKKNDSLDFRFTDAKDAADGLKSGDYYMVITIPEDFSANATTLMDDQPKKMELDYQTNPGTNYIASKLSETAMLKVRDEIASQVTQTYAQVIFDQIGTAGDGMQTAADGAAELKDGIQTAADGNETITTNLETLANSTLTFKSGADSLTNGLKSYTDGVAQLASGAQTLSDGTDTLVSGTANLASGTTQYVNGVNTLASGITSYVSGTRQLAQGAGQLSGLESLGQVSTGIQELSSGVMSGGKTLTDSTTQLENGLGQLNTQVTQLANSTSAESMKQLTEGLNNAKSGIEGGAAGMSAAALNMQSVSESMSAASGKLSDAATTVSGAGTNITTASGQISDTAATVSGAVGKMSDLLTAEGTAANTQIAAANQQIQTANASLEKVNGQKAQAAADLTALAAKADENGNLSISASELNAIIEALNSTPDGVSTAQTVDALNASEYTAQAETIASGVSEQVTTMQAAVDTITQQLSTAATGLSNGSDSLKTGSDSLKTGASTMSGYAKNMTNGAKSLSDGASSIPSVSTDTVSALQTAVGQLYTGSQKVNSGANTLVATVSSGLIRLENGTKDFPAVAQGITALNQGFDTLTANNDTLTNGAATLLASGSTLTNGATALESGANTLKNGVSTLYNGTQTLANSSAALKSGATQLASGASQIQDGSSQLYEGSKTLGEGMQTISDGAETLSSSLSDGADQIKEVSADDATLEMIADPVETDETQLTTVENNGHAMAPYMMSVGLWVGCLAFCLMYPLTEYKGRLKSGFSWWASKASVLYPVAILQGFLLIGLLHIFIGFTPAELIKTVAFACLTSVAFTSIMYFFNVTLGKVGSFLMLIFMVIQLAGSAGTYPVEISPSFVAKIHNYLPFTYTVNAFRSTIAGGESILTSVLVLLAITVVFTGLTIVQFQLMAHEKQAERKTVHDWLEERGVA